MVGLLGSGLIFANRVRIAEFARDFKKEPLPVAVSYENASGKKVTTGAKDPAVEILVQAPTSTAPKEAPKVSQEESPLIFNLAVPFTPQAPHANWEQPYQDACEEASVAMVHYFYSKKTFTPEVADREILNFAAFEQKALGFDKDTTAEQTSEMARGFYGYKKVEVISNPTIDAIKKHIAAGRPVVLPVYGRALNNPYFTPPGPDYHMLVVKGYTRDKFITNDPGTKRGADYLYSFDVLMNAIHDFNGGDVPNGKKVMIVIYPN